MRETLVKFGVLAMRSSWAIKKFPIPLETPEQNYWLGFLIGDGNVGGKKGNGYNLRCDLAAKDGYLVSQLANFLGTRSYSYRRVVRCQIACTADLDYLKHHGLIPTKGGREIYPKTVTNHGSFIRGFFDADGCYCVATGRNNVKFLCVETSSGIDILEKISWVFYQEVNLVPSIIKRKDRNCFQLSLSLGRKNAGRLYDFLYADEESPRLHRKQRIIRIFSEKPKANGSKNHQNRVNPQERLLNKQNPQRLICSAPSLG